LTRTGATGPGEFGYSVALSGDASTAVIGEPGGSGLATGTSPGAAWVFTQPIPTHFAISVPPSAVTGTSVNFTITAQDASSNTITNYAGVVHFTSSDSLATLPADTQLTNGTANFAVSFATTGAQTITATDAAIQSITGTSSGITVSGAATHLIVTVPAIVVSGVLFPITVTALDANNHTATAYTGTVHFTSTDPAATLPANTTLTNGVATLSATLATGASQTITATDTVNATIMGTSEGIAVSAAGSGAPAGNVQGVPTLSEWGLVLFAMLLATAGAMHLRRAQHR
jgi:IPTL-CTERM motif/FG-GAP repeat